MRAMRRLGKGVMHSWVCSKLRIQVPAILACRALDAMRSLCSELQAIIAITSAVEVWYTAEKHVMYTL